MGVLGFTHFFQEIEEDAPCPTVAIGPLSNTEFFPTEGTTANAIIVQGEAPYSIVSTPGLPSGITASISGGSNLLLTETGLLNAQMGSYNFTVNVEDNNGCPGSRSFTIVVGAVFSSNTVREIQTDCSDVAPLPVSGLPNELNVNVVLNAVEFSTLTGTNSDFSLSVLEPSDTGEVFPVFFGELLGSNITNAVVYSTTSSYDYPGIGTGTAPYTGNWKATASDYDLSLASFNPNGDWIIRPCMSGGPGDLTFIKLKFLPL